MKNYTLHYKSKLLFLMQCVLFLSVGSNKAFGQIGGKRSFEFLNVSPSARLNALGGMNVSLHDRDINFAFSNPALLGDTLTGFASANHQFYVADIGNSAFTYYDRFNSVGNIAVGIQHINYGSIEGFDASGQATSEFSNGETAIVISKNRQVGNFRLGASLKGVFSNIAGYNSTGLAVDIGGLFIHPQQSLTVGLVLKNLGIVLSEYTETSTTNLPLDVQFGTTFKPKYMPFRFSLTAFNLTRPQTTYDDPAVEEDNANAVHEILAHLNVGAELLLHKNVNILFGYNFLNHQALKLENGGGGAGLTVGFSAAIKSVDFSFSRMGYVNGTAAYSFTLSANVKKFFKH